MTWIIVLVIAGVVIFYFLKDRDTMLEQNTDSYGGMRQKYANVIAFLTEEPTAKVVKVTRDHIHISNSMNRTRTDFFFTENFDGLEAEWNADLNIMGKHKLKWKFKTDTPEEQIIEKMMLDMDEYSKKNMPF